MSKRITDADRLWEGARLVIADVPLERQKAQSILPWGMRLTNPPTATVFIANYIKTAFTAPYKEAAMLIHVKTPLGQGVHCCWMIVDDDTALIYGRELLGYPKKMGDFTFEENGDHVSASITRRGVTVLRMELERGPAQQTPPPVFAVKTFNAGGLGQFFRLNPVWMFKAKEEIHESYSAQVSVTFARSEPDPLAELVSGEPLRGRFVVLDIIGGGRMVPVGLAGPRWLDKVHNMRFI